MKKYFAFIVLLTVVLAGCNKNQKAVRKISDGEWEVVTFKENGQDIFNDFDSWEGKATFDRCRQESQGSCSGELVFDAQLSTVEDGIPVTADIDLIVTFDYETLDKGSRLQVDVSATETTVSAQALGFSLGSETETEVCQIDCTSRGDISDDYTMITIDGGVREIVLKKI